MRGSHASVSRATKCQSVAAACRDARISTKKREQRNTSRFVAVASLRGGPSLFFRSYFFRTSWSASLVDQFSDSVAIASNHPYLAHRSPYRVARIWSLGICLNVWYTTLLCDYLRQSFIQHLREEKRYGATAPRDSWPLLYLVIAKLPTMKSPQERPALRRHVAPPIPVRIQRVRILRQMQQPAIQALPAVQKVNRRQIHRARPLKATP